MSFGRFSGKTTRRGQALAVTRACDNSSPLVNQLGVNTWIWQPVSRNILSILFLSRFLSLIFFPLLLRPSDRNVKRNHYSPYDIANIVNSLPALCALSITLSVRAMYAFSVHVSHAYDITLSLKLRSRVVCRHWFIYIFRVLLDIIYRWNSLNFKVFSIYTHTRTHISPYLYDRWWIYHQR